MREKQKFYKKNDKMTRIHTTNRTGCHSHFRPIQAMIALI